MDGMSSADDKQQLPLDDNRVLAMWNELFVIDESHYQLDIPFKHEYPNLPNNRPVVEK